MFTESKETALARKKARELANKMDSKTSSSTDSIVPGEMDHKRSRYPFCIVWTPIPFLTWTFPFVGHMGIATSSGVIRDFAGPYYVSEDNMGFGKPTRYWELDPNLAVGGQAGWDRAVSDASEVYNQRMHNLFCDNCHSHVGLALNQMQYKGQQWNMIKLAFLMFICGKYVSVRGFMKTWLPFLVIVGAIVTILLYVYL